MTRAVRLLALGALALSVILPLVWVVFTSLKDSPEIFAHPWSPPAAWKIRNYSDAWTEASIGVYFVNSLLITIVTLLILIPTGAMAAYIFAKYPFRGSKLLFGTFLGGLAFPHFLVIVPLYLLINQMGLLDTKLGLVLVYVAYSLAFTVFVLTGFFQALPNELAEAAMLDGCGHGRTFFRIMLPLARPGILVVTVFNAIGLWNEYGFAKVLMSSRENFTLSLGMDNLMMTQQYQANWGALFAGMVILMTPVVALYWMFRDRIYETVVAGAVKG